MLKNRTFMLSAGVAALISSQALSAAPTASDPLVSLSVLASDASRAAVCAGSAAAAAAAGQVAPAVPGPGCVLPITAVPAPAPVAELPAPPPPPMIAATAAPKAIGTLPLLLGLAAVIALAAVLLSNGHNGKGSPISPA